MCVTREALLDGLVRRVRDGHRVTREELDALLRAGLSREQLAAAFGSEPGVDRDDAMTHAMQTLRGMR